MSDNRNILKLTENKLHERWGDLGYDALDDQEKECVALYWLIAEVANGGCDQYFFNSSGNMALYARAGLCRIGNTEATDLFDTALATIPDGYTIDRQVRQTRLLKLPDDGLSFREFDIRFDRLSASIEQAYLAALNLHYSQKPCT